MKCGSIMLNLKGNAQSKQWKRAGIQPPKTFKLSPSDVKAIGCLWYSHEIILAHFMLKRQTATIRYYSEVILKKKKERKKELQIKLKQLCPRLAPKKCPSFAWQCPISYHLINSRRSTLSSVNCRPILCTAQTLTRPRHSPSPTPSQHTSRATFISFQNWTKAH